MKSCFALLTLVIIFSCSEPPSELAKLDLTLRTNTLKLTVNNDSLPADGKTYAEIRISVGSQVLKTSTEVILKAGPGGRFLSNNESVETITLSTSGQAVAYVTSSQKGVVYIEAQIGSHTSAISLEFFEYHDPAASFAFEVFPSTTIADNYSEVEIRARAENAERYRGKNVIFTTDNGTFTNGQKSISVSPDVNGLTKAYLKSSKVDTAHISVRVLDSFDAQVTANFIKAEPTGIKIEPEMGYIDSGVGSKLMLNARLNRDFGFATEGQAIQLRDATVSNTSIGVFLNTTLSGPDGELSSEYHLQDSTYKGFLFIKGSFRTSEGTILMDSVKILIK